MVHNLKFELLVCRSSEEEEEEEEVRSQEAGSGGREVLLGVACQVDHFGSLEEDISACRSIDCCGNVADAKFHYCSGF